LRLYPINLQGDTGDVEFDEDDEELWEEVGPGKVGVATFGANMGAGRGLHSFRFQLKLSSSVLHSFTLELISSNSRTRSWVQLGVIRWTEELKLS